MKLDPLKTKTHLRMLARAKVDYPDGRTVVYREGKTYDIITHYAVALVAAGKAEHIKPAPPGRSVQVEKETPDAAAARSTGPGAAFVKPGESRRRPERFDGPPEGSPAGEA